MSSDRLAALIVSRGVAALTGWRTVDEIVEVALSSLRPYRLHVPRGDPVRVSIHGIWVGSTMVSRTNLSAAMQVRSQVADDSHYKLTLPVAGRAHFSSGAVDAVAMRGAPVLLGPHRESVHELDAGFDRVTVRVPPSHVRAAAASIWPSLDADDIEFAMSPDRSLDGVVSLLEAAIEVARLAPSPERTRLLHQFELVLAETLLLTQPNSAASAATAVEPDAASRQVREAMDYMLDRIGEPLTMAGAAAAAGVSVRSLQSSFAKVTGMSPSRWLRARRLDRASMRLRETDRREVTVASIAAECGLFHLGDFSAAFKARFGLTPSEVRRSTPDGQLLPPPPPARAITDRAMGTRVPQPPSKLPDSV